MKLGSIATANVIAIVATTRLAGASTAGERSRIIVITAETMMATTGKTGTIVSVIATSAASPSSSHTRDQRTFALSCDQPRIFEPGSWRNVARKESTLSIKKQAMGALAYIE